MKSRHLFLTLLLFILAQGTWAQNPILRKGDLDFMYLADPSTEVYDGKVYVYCSHDVDTALNYQANRIYPR